MNKLLSVLSFLAIANFFGQVTTPSNSSVSTSYFGSAAGINFDLPFKISGVEKMRLTTAGKFGIGTATPSVKLEVNESANGLYAAKIYNSGVSGNGLLIQGGSGLNSTGAYSLLNVLDNSGNSLFNIDGYTQSTNVNGSFFVKKASNTLRLLASNPGVEIGSSTGTIDFWYPGVGNTQINCGNVFVKNGGNILRFLANNPGVEIGSSTGIIEFWYPGVGSNQINCGNIRANGNIWAKEVQIALVNPFPDYVFESNYNLKPLREVENHIKKFGHLSNMPSAKQVETEGLNVGNVTTILVEKVEELTLYLIEQQKTIDALKIEISELKLEKK